MTAPTRERNGLFSALVWLVSLAILLQGVWAGIFIRQGQTYDGTWVIVHARGAEVSLALALASAVVAVWRLRSRRDLVLASVALVVLLGLEAFIGGLVFDHPGLQVVHFPLALSLMALAVWLPFRARR